MRELFDLVRDVLDKQLVDREEEEMGRVDGIVLNIAEGQPTIDHLELGFSVLALRLGPRVERWLKSLRERWSVRKSARQIVPWTKVLDLNPHFLKVDLKVEETPAFDWERAMRRFVKKIPGSGGE